MKINRNNFKTQNSPKHGITRRAFLKKAGKTTAVIAVAGAAPELIRMKSKALAKGEYDIIIKGGTLYDGISPEPRLADVAIKGDKIVAIGEVPGSAGKTIDAKDLIITPGFIDVHTHCDITFKRTGWKRYLSYFMPSWKGNHNYLYQGVTTVVSGNCGYGYSDSGKWFGMLKTLGFGSNVYHLAPHGMIREELFGENQPRDLTRLQLDMFKGRVAEEMEKGAIGLSTGLEYAPGIYASSDELVELLKVVRRYGGLHTTHRRDETARIHDDGEPGALKSTKEAIDIARRAEIPVEISHLKIAPPYNDVKPTQLLDLISEARDEGLDITADQYPYIAGSTYITIFLPNEFKAKLGVKDEFKTKSGREEIKKAIKEVFSYLGPNKILVSFYPGEDSYEGKTLKQISEETGKSPAECYANMVCDDQPPIGIFFYLKEDDVRALMKPDFILTSSDGWTVPKDMTKPHPRCYGTFPKKVRDFALKEEMLDLPGAIRSMTSLPAEKFKFKGRGKVMEGYYADLAVIDLKKMAAHATYLDPHQYATGVRHLLVNGVLSISDGKATGDRGGKPLRRG